MSCGAVDDFTVVPGAFDKNFVVGDVVEFSNCSGNFVGSLDLDRLDDGEYSVGPDVTRLEGLLVGVVTIGKETG